MDSHHLSILASSNSPLHSTLLFSHQSTQITATSSLANGKTFQVYSLSIKSSWPLIGPVWSYLNGIPMFQAHLPLSH